MQVFARPVRRINEAVARDLVSCGAEAAHFLVGVQVAGGVPVPKVIGAAPDPVPGRWRAIGIPGATATGSTVT